MYAYNLQKTKTKRKSPQKKVHSQEEQQSHKVTSSTFIFCMATTSCLIGFVPIKIIDDWNLNI